jgi:hypothetical protein
MAGLTGSAPQFTLIEADRLTPHERVDDADVKRLSEEIRAEGAMHEPILVDRSTQVILDGHHRYHALQRLGCRLVPSYAVDYLEPTITVERWGSRELMDKQDLLRQALAGERYPIKTSQHSTRFALPPRSTPLSQLGRTSP